MEYCPPDSELASNATQFDSRYTAHPANESLSRYTSICEDDSSAQLAKLNAPP